MLDLFNLKFFNVLDNLQEKSKNGYKNIHECKIQDFHNFIIYDNNKIMRNNLYLDDLFNHILSFKYQDDHIEISNKYNDEIIIIKNGKSYYK